MIPPGTILQDAIQVLGNPAWVGIGVIVSSTIAIIALCKANKSQSPSLSQDQLLKKCLRLGMEVPTSY